MKCKQPSEVKIGAYVFGINKTQILFFMYQVKPLNHMHLSCFALLKDVLIPGKNNHPVIIIFLYTSAQLETLCT